ncbi:hypothetical protein ABZS66_26590 [Dactylosporangium sp. NPDC005572]|uniref:hypothetical protein n=1 Tax=Dactylosporangium sp. NPDC005572 TaxID=3156889 RepID=UPI00339FD3A3
MIHNRLRGLWALIVGGALIVVLLVILDPITRHEDCPNYQANGNASAFGNDNWDLGFPLVLLVWMTAVVVEQAWSVTRRSAFRAAVAVLLSVIGSCWLFATVAVVCR